MNLKQGEFDERLSSHVLDELLAESIDAIITVDDVGKIRYASPGISLLLGYDVQVVVGRSIFSFLHPDDLDFTNRMFGERIEYDGTDLDRLTRVQHASGHWILAQTIVTLLSDSDLGAAALTIRGSDAAVDRETMLRHRLGAEEYCNKLSNDFSEMTQPLDILNRLEQSLREVGLLTGADIAVAYLERQERDTLERVARWTLPEYADTPEWSSLDTRMDPLSVDQLLTKMHVIDDLALPEHRALQEFFGPTDLAAVLWVPFVAGDRRGLFGVGRFGRDRSWREADTYLIRRVGELYARSLHRSRIEQLLALTYEQGPIGFSIRTRDGGFIECNQQYLDIYGLTRQEAERRNIFDIIDPSDGEALNPLIDQLHLGQLNRVRYEMAVTRSDRTQRWVRANTVRIDSPGSVDELILTSIEDITEMYNQRQELEHAARHDALTGAATRTTLMVKIDELWDKNQQLPDLLIIDLDKFKLINDSFGHAVGDVVLQEVMRRIDQQTSPDDLVARLGGDEFVIVVPDPAPGAVEMLAEGLRATTELPIIVDGRSLHQTISIGVAIGKDCVDPAELFLRADRAMYAAKEKGRNRYVVFDELMRDQALVRVSIERDLRRAIDGDQFEVHFQPEFSLADGQILGAEALVRWRHPNRGMLTAATFIEIAEQTGLVEDIGRFALREACRSFAEVAALGNEHLMLRVNISGREFSRPELPDLVRSALSDSGLSPGRLCLEMTETTLMDSPEVVGETFDRLHAIGVEFAIDDFGTGYSSLAYLKRFPVDALKIDRSFVEDLATNTDSRAIVESIIRLSSALSLEVIAEGIETDEQLAILRALGCERAQGYLVSPALPPGEFATFVGG